MAFRSLAQASGAALCAFALLGASHTLAPIKKPVPDATLKVSSTSIAPGSGVSWGVGKVHYKGHYYDLQVEGLSVGRSVDAVTAVGKIYHLAKIEDVAGQYSAGNVPTTTGGGGSMLVMKNASGVEIRMSATARGVNLTAPVSGVKLSLKQ